MKLSLIGEQSRSLLTDFDAAGVSYELQRPQPGVIMNAGEAVIIALAVLPTVANVIVEWIRHAPTRKVMITTPDNAIVQAEGRTVAEVEQLLKTAKQVMVMDAKKAPVVAWTKSKWSKDELDGKHVEFRVRTELGVEHGVGKFLVRQNPEGLLAIEIEVDQQGHGRMERTSTRYFPTKDGVLRIERHPDQSIAAFRLFD